MPLTDSDLVWRPSVLRSSSVPAQNGGAMAMSTLVSGVKNNLFPDVGQLERASGSVSWRKCFMHINSSDDSPLLNVRLFLESMTPADDFVTFAQGTAHDTEAELTTRVYGIGQLLEPSAPSDSQLLIRGEQPAGYAALEPFRIGDSVRIAQGADHEEFVTLTHADYSGESIRLDVEPALTQYYSPEQTTVASVLALPELAAEFSVIELLSNDGSLDTTTPGHLLAHNKGAIEQDWLLTFSDTQQFSVAGHLLGTLAIPGAISADFAPLNPATGTPYFTLRASAWGGSFVANDTLRFQTRPAALAVWYRREVPAGSTSLANNYAALMLYGESA